MYTILTSFTTQGCGNVGDKLIEVALKDILKKERGETEFLTLFRENDITDHIPEINKTKAVLLQACPVRDVPIYPGVYRLTPRLEDIKVPIISAAANWNVYPGDFYDRERICYSRETTDFLLYISSQHEYFSVREHFTGRIIKKHGVKNVIMTGCPTWYNERYMGKPMSRPDRIKRVVFTPPMSFCYTDQAIGILRMLARIFKDADRICCFICGDSKTTPLKNGETGDNSVAMNPEAAEKNERIGKEAEKLGFRLILASHDIENLNFIDECDLHVGYDCHGSISFLRRRKPSVMIAEDARGVGFIYTLGLPEFHGFIRSQYQTGQYTRPSNTSGYCDSLATYSIAAADASLAQRLGEFLEEQISNRFIRFSGVAQLIDDAYERAMKPFIHSLP